MTPIDGQPIVTAAQMRAAEDDVIAGGVTADELMARAGTATAAAVARLATGSEVLVLCGPGNNGGDGYVTAATLARYGLPVRVASTGRPITPAAQGACARWIGEVGNLAEADGAPVVVDAVFGTGLSRAVDAGVAASIRRLADEARLSIAVDVPSGIVTDTGALLNDITSFDLTLALGAAKPAHVLMPAASHVGSVRLLDIGVPIASSLHVLNRPSIAAPDHAAHKYSRGMVAVVAGAMPGASALAATAAAGAGGGYVLMLGSATDRVPHSIVRRRYEAAAFDDDRIGAILIGPGLGRDERARDRLTDALASNRPLVIDGDALHLLDPDDVVEREAPVILTPHAGEFDALFGRSDADKISRARDAAARTNATIVFKGSDTVIASPHAAIVAPAASSWLSTAGTGDVLAGTIAARLAVTGDSQKSAAQGVWLHGAAARLSGAAFTADDLALAIPRAVSLCLK